MSIAAKYIGAGLACSGLIGAGVGIGFILFFLNRFYCGLLYYFCGV